MNYAFFRRCLLVEDDEQWMLHADLVNVEGIQGGADDTEQPPAAAGAGSTWTEKTTYPRLIENAVDKEMLKKGKIYILDVERTLRRTVGDNNMSVAGLSSFFLSTNHSSFMVLFTNRLNTGLRDAGHEPLSENGKEMYGLL